jgi:Ca2+-binding RTX toxin-like protein
VTTGTQGNDNLTNDPNVDPETVDALGGDDRITIQRPTNQAPPGFSDTAAVTANGGSGFDTLVGFGNFSSWSYDPATGNGGYGIRSSSNFSYSVTFTSIERFELSGSWFGSSGRIDTGEGDDILGFSPFGGSGTNLSLWTHGGNDQVRISGSFANAVAVTEAGDDIIDFRNVTGGSVGGYGGTGNDLYRLDFQKLNVTIHEFADEGIDEVQIDSGNYVLPANVENLTSFATTVQTLNGNELNNVIVAGTGNTNDVLNGNGGNDTLTGNNGQDRLDGGAGSDTADYSRELGMLGVVVNLSADFVPPFGHPTFGRGVASNEAIDSFGNPDLLVSIENARGTAQSDWLYGSAGANSLWGMGGNDHLEGGAGNDVLDGGTGADRMIGGAGDDTYYVDDAGDTTEENAGEGNDTVFSSAAGYTLGANIENLNGSSNNGQTLTGNDQNNTIVGGSGNDTIDGGGGADVMIGGQGDDVYFVDNPNDQVIENPNEGTDEIRTGLSTYSLETLPNVENLTGIGLGTQTLIGNAGANVITSGAGVDTLIGGNGNDTYIVNNQGDRVQETAGFSGGDDEVQTALAEYSLAGTLGVETLRGTSNSGQSLTGGDEAEAIIGGEGNDTLNGGAGDDVIFGNGGNDILIGLAGFDYLAGGNGDDIYAIDAGDTIFEDFGAGTDEVRTVATIFTLDQNLENLRATSDIGHLFRGNMGPNGIIGGNGNDLILLQDGGGDVVFGLGGDDQLYFGAAFDQYDFANGGEGTDRLILQGNYSAGILFGEQAQGNLNGIERIELLSQFNTFYGGQSATANSYRLTMKDSNVQPGDTLTIDASGLQPNETLLLDATAETSSSYIVLGGAGGDGIATGGASDRITGGGGADSINGGGGADVFVYNAVSESTTGSIDTLVTFQSGADKIDLSAIDADANTAQNDAFNFVGSGAFTNQAGQLRTVDLGGGSWQVQGDVNGDGVADLLINVNTGGAAPLASDFVL